MNAIAQTFSPTRSVNFSSLAGRFPRRVGQMSQQRGRVFGREARMASSRALAPTDDGVNELDRVVLLAEIRTADGLLPVGSKGTAVYRYRNGAAFEVEFTSPVHALITLRANEVSRSSV